MSTSHSLRSSGDKPGRFDGWDRLIKALSRLDRGSCAASTDRRERPGGGVVLALPARCLFDDRGTAPRPEARATLEGIASELKAVTDREFWIAVRTPHAGDGGRGDRARAGAIVDALIAAGVAPDRLAAIVGVGAVVGVEAAVDVQPGAASHPSAIGADQPQIQIVAAPKSL